MDEMPAEMSRIGNSSGTLVFGPKTPVHSRKYVQTEIVDVCVQI